MTRKPKLEYKLQVTIPAELGIWLEEYLEKNHKVKRRFIADLLQEQKDIEEYATEKKE